MSLEFKTHQSYDPEEAEYFFGKKGWPVSYIEINIDAQSLLVPAEKGAALECGDGRSDKFPGKTKHGPRVLGGINMVAAMLTGGDYDGYFEATKRVKALGYEPGTHSADHGGCGYVDLWIANRLRSAVFPYELKHDEVTKRGLKLGDWLSIYMKSLGGKHIKLNGNHVEAAVRLNPFIGLTEGAEDGSRFRIDDWFPAQLGIPARQRYYKIIETVEQLKPDAAKLEIIRLAV